MFKYAWLIVLSFSLLFHPMSLIGQKTIYPGAYDLKDYLPLLKGKKVGVFTNQTAMVGKVHLIDTLQSLGIKITRIFAPEHGFRGNADAGANIDSYIDVKTGINVVSMYGKHRIPDKKDMDATDLLLFDLQDVGLRFYTFISSLQEFMEAAANYHKTLIILDRPNPNGFYVDGPVLDTAFRSFVGMQPIPIVYGMTLGEYALMLRSEHWLRISRNETLDIKIIRCRNYTHSSHYSLPQKPSPNLPDMSSVYWYPSTCFFEGTLISEGRGTTHPFCIIGHPDFPHNMYAFTPEPRPGASSPKFSGKICYGWNLYGKPEEVLQKTGKHIHLEYLLKAYRLLHDSTDFFKGDLKADPKKNFFNLLAGNSQLMQQIEDGLTEKEIRKTWEPGLKKFMLIRKKYLLYKDFN